MTQSNIDALNEMYLKLVKIAQSADNADDTKAKLDAANAKVAQIAILQTSEAAAKAKVTDLEKAKKDLEDQIAKLNTDSGADKAKVTALEEELKQLKLLLDDKEKDLAAVLNHNEELEKNKDTAEAEKKALEDQIAKLSADSGADKAKVTELEKEKIELESAKNKFEDEAKTHKTESESKDSEISALKAKLDEMQKAKDSLEAAKLDLEKSNTDLEAKYKKELEEKCNAQLKAEESIHLATELESLRESMGSITSENLVSLRESEISVDTILELITGIKEKTPFSDHLYSGNPEAIISSLVGEGAMTEELYSASAPKCSDTGGY